MLTRHVRILAFVLPAAVGPAAWAAVTASLNNEGSTTLHEIQVRPGDSFTVDLNLDIIGQERVGWLWTRVQASANGGFDITGGAYMETPTGPPGEFPTAQGGLPENRPAGA